MEIGKAIKIIKEMLAASIVQNFNAWDTEGYEALHMAVKALETQQKRERCGYDIANSLYLPEDTVYCNPNISKMVEQALEDYKSKVVLRKCIESTIDGCCDGK